MNPKNKKASSDETSGQSAQANAELSPAQPAASPDGTVPKTVLDAAGPEATITTSQPISGAINSTPSALACIGTHQKTSGAVDKKEALPEGAMATGLAVWDIVPSIVLPDLSALSFDDLLSAAEKAWKFGRLAHDVAVVVFQEIMERYDGRKSTAPPMKVEEAFASIGVKYEAARKLVYRDRKKRDLEAIAASFYLPRVPRSTPCAFNVGDEVTITDGQGVIANIHQTTGKIDVVLEDGEATVANVNPKHVTKLNGVAVVDGKVIKQKEHALVGGELLIDPVLGKKWTYTDGKFSVSNLATRKEVKQAAIDKLMVERTAALKRKQDEKKTRKDEADRKDSDKINAAKAKREAAQAKREAEHAKREAARLRKEEEKNKRKAEAARKKAAKVEAAKAKREAKLLAKVLPKKTTGTNVTRTFQWNLIKGSTDPKPYVVSNNKGEILSRVATESEAAAEVERLTTKHQAPTGDVAAGAHIAAARLVGESIIAGPPSAPMQPELSVATV